MKEYETIADLTSSKQSSTGLLLWCRENLLYYIVQADGYTATGDDITFSNGRVGKAIDIADASQIKTITGNVQDDLSSIISGGLPSQVGQAGEYLRTDGTNAYWDSVVGLGAIGKTPEEYGAVGDGVTDDTAALQAAIDAIKGSGALGLPTNYLVLEAKTYAHTGLVIDRAINIIGKDRNASRLKCLTTSAAAISVSLEYDTTNYQTAGRPGPTVAIKDCIIESDKGFAATNYGIRAFDATTNHIRGWIYLDGVDIHSMGGDALFANTWEGAIKAVNCKFINNAGKQINATSCADWQFIGCEFGVTPDDNILLSGCAAFTFTTCNIYSSTGDLVTLFTDAAATAPVNHQFVSCSFDRSSMGHGVIYNVRNDGNVTFTNCYWTYNGQGAPETYSDIWIDASVGRGPTIVGGWMQDPSISDSLYNIFFNGTSSSCYTAGVQFEGGNARSTNVTNSLPQLKFEGAENFDTFADLEASTWPEIGDEVKVVAGANAPFIIKDEGSYTALAGDRTLANGRVGELQVAAEDIPDKFESFTEALSRIDCLVGVQGREYSVPAFTLTSNKAIKNINLKYTGIGGENFIDLDSGNNADGISIKGCRIDATGADAAVRGSKNGNLSITGNEIFGCSKVGVQVTGISAATENESLEISDNWIHDTGEDCVEVRSSINGKIENNTFEGWGATDPSSNAVELQEYHESLSLKNNTFVNTSGTLFGIEVAGSTAKVYNSSISNNLMNGDYTGISGKIEYSSISGNVFKGGNGTWRSGVEVIGPGNLINANTITDGAIAVASNGNGDGSGGPSLNSNKTKIIGNSVTTTEDNGRALLIGTIVNFTGTPTSHDIDIKSNTFDMSGATGTGLRVLLVGEYTNGSQLSNINILDNTIVGPSGVASTEGIRLKSLSGGGTVNVKGNTVKDVNKALRINDDNLSRVNFRFNDVSQGVTTVLSDASTTTTVTNSENDT